MNKDALLATAIGFFIGLVITGLLLVGPSIMKKVPKISISLPSFPKNQFKAPSPSPKISENQQLTIDSPIAESIESEKDLLISGKAKAGAIVVIQGVSTESAVIANSEGAFAAKITLIEGKNDIIVTANSKDSSTTQHIPVFYTPEAL